VVQFIPSKVQIGEFICSPIAGRLIKLLFPILKSGGLVLDLASDVVPPRTAAALRFGLIERAERRVLKSVLSRDLPVIELGAGYGSVTLAIAEHIGQHCPIMIVEANPSVSEWWRHNIKRSERKHVRFVDAAVFAAADDFVSFVVEPSLLGSRVGVDDGAPTAMVKVRSVQSICEESGFNRFSLVCDIEGAEYSLFDGGAGGCLSACDSIVMEMHPTAERQTQKLIALFATYGLKHVETQHDVLGFVR
jgi:FkbM family methyltransferase